MSFHKLLFVCVLLLSAVPSWADGVLTPAAGQISGTTINNSTFYDYTTGFKLQDDFFAGNVTTGSIGALGWGTGGGVAATSPVSETNHPGLIQRSTGSSSGSTAYLYLPFTQGSLLAGSVDLFYLARLNTNDSNTTVRIGAMYLINTTPTDGVYLEKLDADTNWFCVTRAASTQTRVDTGVAVGTGWVKLRVVRTGNASVACTVDGIGGAANTANIPTAQGLTVGLAITNSAAAIKTIDLDYFEMTRTGLTR